jgi:hypothetical protein
MDAIAFWLSAFLVIGLFSALSLGVLRLVAAGLPRNVARLAAVAIGAALAIAFRALAHADGGPLRWDLSVDYLLPAAAMLALVALLGRRKPDDA